MEPNDPNQPPKTAPEVDNMPEPAESAAPVPTPTESGDTPDPQTDQAVDDITKHEADESLKAQDEAAKQAVVMKQGFWERCKNGWHDWWGNPRKRWGTIGTVVVLLAVVFALPITRYNVLGLVLKGTVSVQVVDSKSGTPVSGATVELGGQRAESDAQGKASLKVHAGSKTLQVSKSYYKGYTKSELVGLSGNSYKATLTALGRQVRIKVVNKITGKPVTGAVVRAGTANAKTAANGTATIVIPSSSSTQAAKVSLGGYNTAAITVTAAGDLAKNTFALTPAGKLYFLSNLSGKIDVVKTNLDGTDRQTVLAGTGNEDPNSTSLLASRDWKYLALLAKRSGNNASVYLIDTTDGDKLTTIDEGNANFSLVGWSGDRFIYQVYRNTVSDWQPNQEALKSFDATTGQTLSLDQTQASGSSENDFAKQAFGSPYIIGSQIVYAKDWSSSYYNTAGLNGKAAELDSINADGSGHKVIKTFALAAGESISYIGISTQLYEPDGLYVWFSDNGQNSFYDYDDGTISPDTKLTADTYYQTPYPTYLLSPSGNQTFWSEQRDGKNALFVGDADGKNQKQIASLSEYDTYGWYTDNYLLVSKGSSELYVMPTGGGTPLKITDYYKPAINYNGYGGGYGGR